jgi:hypothetical protein
VQESTVYQMIIERGIEQGIERGIEQGRQLGAKEFAIDNILNLLNNRFKVNVAATLTPSLEAIDDLDNFRILIREASESEHLEDFLHVLETCGNGMQ